MRRTIGDARLSAFYNGLSSPELRHAMPYYTKLGQLPPKRHIQFRRPDGALYSEEVFGTEGFVGPTSTLYHIHPPTQVTGWKGLYSTKPEYVETGVMRMRHVKSAARKPQGDPGERRNSLQADADRRPGGPPDQDQRRERRPDEEARRLQRRTYG